MRTIHVRLVKTYEYPSIVLSSRCTFSISSSSHSSHAITHLIPRERSIRRNVGIHYRLHTELVIIPVFVCKSCVIMWVCSTFTSSSAAPPLPLLELWGSKEGGTPQSLIIGIGIDAALPLPLSNSNRLFTLGKRGREKKGPELRRRRRREIWPSWNML